MDLIRILVALHPKSWRDRYGEEFTALLEDSRLTPGGVIDVLAHTVRLHVRARRRAVLTAAALVISLACYAVGRVEGLAPNILWAPTDLPRGLLLAGAVGPWLALTATACFQRRAAAGG